MILVIRKDKHKFANGSYKTQIRVTEGYRDPVTGKPKQKTIKSFGYLEDNENQEAFMQMVKDFDIQFKKTRKSFLTKLLQNLFMKIIHQMFLTLVIVF